ncbi:MAG: hypothetical protein AAF439_12865 [Pseudomonadota bacterium]
MGPLHDLDIGYVAIIALTAFVATAGAVVVTGFLPRHSGPTAAQGAAGFLLVWGAVLAVGVLTIAGLAAALSHHWAITVISAGLAFLAAPFAVQPLPAILREGRLALVLVILAALAAAVLLVQTGHLSALI